MGLACLAVVRHNRDMSDASFPSITIEQARAFCEVARSSTYAAAADRLAPDRAARGQSHVRVIRLIGRFAAALGHRPRELVHTDNRGGVTLTALGLEVLPLARRLVDAADALQVEQRAVRFSTYPSIAGQVVAACPELLDAEVPLLLTDVSEVARRDGGAQLVRDVADGILDIAVAPASLGVAGVEERLLYRWSLCCLPPGRRGSLEEEAATIRPADMQRFAIAAAPSGHRSREALERAFADDDVRLVVAVESSSQELLRDLAAHSSRHVAVVPDDAFGSRLPDAGQPGGTPRIVSRSTPWWGGDYALYWRAADHPASDHAAAMANTIAVAIAVRRGAA